MSLTTILSEIWRFVWEKKIKIIIGSVLVAILTVLAIQFLAPLGDKALSSEEEEESDAVVQTEEYNLSREYLTNVYEQEPAEFEMFVQLEDGTVFPNSFIFDEYFSSPEIVKEVERSSNVPFSETLEHEDKLKTEKNSQYRGSIAGIRDTSTNVITIRVQVGQTSQENLAIATSYYDLIQNNEIPFAEGFKITSMSGPGIGEKLMGSNLNMVSSINVLSGFTVRNPDSQSNGIYAIIGLIIGLLSTTVMLFIVQLFKKKISYAFQYSWDFDDQHILFNIPEDNNNTLTELLDFPKLKNRIIISETPELLDELIAIQDKFNIVTDLISVDDTPDEIVLIVESGTTNKNWYNNQYRLAEIFNTQIKIIQIIN